jgi:hypothetical protein
MPIDERPNDESGTAPSGIQFSLRALLLLPVLIGAVCAVLFATPPAVAVLQLMVASLVLPAALTTVVIYGKGYKRTFCIGALFPSGALFLGVLVTAPGLLFGWPTDGVDEVRWFIVATWSAAVFSGLVCMGVRWSIETNRPLCRLGLGALMVLLLLAGPIIGRIGVYEGWWEATPRSSTIMPAPVPAPAPAPPPGDGGQPPAPDAAPAPAWDPYADTAGTRPDARKTDKEPRPPQVHRPE